MIKFLLKMIEKSKKEKVYMYVNFLYCKKDLF